MQLLVFHGSTQLLLQVPDVSVRCAAGSVLGMRVRLPRLLAHLVLHTDASQAEHSLHQRPQVYVARARRLPRPVLRDLRPLVQQDRRQKRIVRRRRIAVPSHAATAVDEHSAENFPVLIICGARRYARTSLSQRTNNLISYVLVVSC